jgi:hypothetical protein
MNGTQMINRFRIGWLVLLLLALAARTAQAQSPWISETRSQVASLLKTHSGVTAPPYPPDETYTNNSNGPGNFTLYNASISNPPIIIQNVFLTSQNSSFSVDNNVYKFSASGSVSSNRVNGLTGNLYIGLGRNLMEVVFAVPTVSEFSFVPTGMLFVPDSSITLKNDGGLTTTLSSFSPTTKALLPGTYTFTYDINIPATSPPTIRNINYVMSVAPGVPEPASVLALAPLLSMTALCRRR